MDNNNIISTLNTLIETSRDGDKGFMACADNAKDASLKAYFTICAKRCRQSVEALEKMVLDFGGTPESLGSVMGAFHRAWLNLQTALSSNDDLAVLEECERAEDVAKHVYSEALLKKLPLAIRALVQDQFDGVIHNHDRVRKLRDEKRLSDKDGSPPAGTIGIDDIGEGSYSGSHGYQASIENYLAHADVEKDARNAAPANAGEARELIAAEQAGREHVELARAKNAEDARI